MMRVRDAIGKNGTTMFEGYGDLSLTELLPAILTRYCETDLLIAAPQMPEQATEIIQTWMRRQLARMDGKGKLNYVKSLTIVTDVSLSASAVAEWAKGGAFEDRVRVIDRTQEDTMIVLPDFAIVGPVNMRYGEHFTATATARTEIVEMMKEKALGMLTADGDNSADEEETEQNGDEGATASAGLPSGDSEGATDSEGAAKATPTGRRHRRN